MSSKTNSLRRIATTCLLSAFIGVLWMLLFSSFTIQCFVAGFLVGYGLTLLCNLIAGRVYERTSPARGVRYVLQMMPWAVSLIFVFIWELIKANALVLATVFSPKLNTKPGIVALPVDLDSDFKIMLLANMITLTPGTISIEIATDNSVIFVHALDCSDPQGVIDSIDKAFTRRLKGMKWHDFQTH